MKLTSARLLMALLLGAVLLLGTRLVWVASKTETSSQTLGLSWYNAALWWIGLEPEPIGLGLERLIQFITGTANIRDVIPFPRTPGNAEF